MQKNGLSEDEGRDCEKIYDSILCWPDYLGAMCRKAVRGDFYQSDPWCAMHSVATSPVGSHHLEIIQLGSVTTPPVDSGLIRCIQGNVEAPVTVAPQWLVWNGGTVRKGVAEAIYLNRSYGDMPLLADALEEAGCDNPDILDHCRAPTHTHGCWLLDALTGRDKIVSGWGCEGDRPAARLHQASHQPWPGDVPGATRKVAEAEQGCDQAQKVYGKLAQNFPAILDYRHLLTMSQIKLGASQQHLGRVLSANGRPQEAVMALGEAVMVYEKLAQDNPYCERMTFDHPLANIQYELGLALSAAGKLVEADKAYRNAVKLFDALAQNSMRIHRNAWGPPNAEETRKWLGPMGLTAQTSLQGVGKNMNTLAWILVTCPEQKVRDHVRGVNLAKCATKWAAHEGTNWTTLGVACHRVGDWNAAQTALEKSVQLRQGGDSYDWFFLAMANWQLGKIDQARTWYQRAVEWMAKHRPHYEELRHFRAEAAALLGLPDPYENRPEGIQILSLADFVVKEAICPELKANSKDGVLREMVEHLRAAGCIRTADVEDVVKALLQRELLGSTGIGRGIAVPRTRHASLERVIATVAVSRTGVPFESLDGEPADVFVMLISPLDRPADHQRASEAICRNLRDEGLVRSLRQARTREAIWELLSSRVPGNLGFVIAGRRSARVTGHDESSYDRAGDAAGVELDPKNGQRIPQPPVRFQGRGPALHRPSSV